MRTRPASGRLLTDEETVQEYLGYRRHTRRRNLEIVGGGTQPFNDERPLTFQGVGPLDESSRRDGAIPR